MLDSNKKLLLGSVLAGLIVAGPTLSTTPHVVGKFAQNAPVAQEPAKEGATQDTTTKEKKKDAKDLKKGDEKKNDSTSISPQGHFFQTAGLQFGYRLAQAEDKAAVEQKQPAAAATTAPAAEVKSDKVNADAAAEKTDKKDAKAKKEEKAAEPKASASEKAKDGAAKPASPHSKAATGDKACGNGSCG